MPASVTRDAYGFEIDCTPEQLQVRKRCDERQAQQAAKWAKYEARQRQLPTGEKLKKLCRKACPFPPFHMPLLPYTASSTAATLCAHASTLADTDPPLFCCLLSHNPLARGVLGFTCST